MKSLLAIQLVFFLVIGSASLTSCSESEETSPVVVQGNQHDSSLRGRDANIAPLLERRGLN